MGSYDTLHSESPAPMAVDPVCGRSVNPHTAFWMIWYRGTPYYFCGETCQTQFDRHPRRYREKALQRRESERIY